MPIHAKIQEMSPTKQDDVNSVGPVMPVNRKYTLHEEIMQRTSVSTNTPADAVLCVQWTPSLLVDR